VTLFICTNCARPGLAAATRLREAPATLPVKWPFQAHKILVPCAGKLQPEHLLKAFEAGTDLVCVLACAEDNCHYLEGSRRAVRRIEHLRSLLDEVGIGGERLLAFHLPGSAKEDVARAGGVGVADAGALD
jgi:coenzyme F420-reducing hydrogenase delta subunit